MVITTSFYLYFLYMVTWSQSGYELFGAIDFSNKHFKPIQCTDSQCFYFCDDHYTLLSPSGLFHYRSDASSMTEAIGIYNGTNITIPMNITLVKANETNSNDSLWSLSYYNINLRRSDPTVFKALELISFLNLLKGEDSILSSCFQPKACSQDWTAYGTTSTCEKTNTVCDYKCDLYHFGYNMKVACDASSGTWTLGTPFEYFQYFPEQACTQMKNLCANPKESNDPLGSPNFNPTSMRRCNQMQNVNSSKQWVEDILSNSLLDSFQIQTPLEGDDTCELTCIYDKKPAPGCAFLDNYKCDPWKKDPDTGKYLWAWTSSCTPVCITQEKKRSFDAMSLFYLLLSGCLVLIVGGMFISLCNHYCLRRKRDDASSFHRING